MDNFFSSDSITALDFARFSTTFLITMLANFGLRERRQRWITWLGGASFSVMWFAAMFFPTPFATRFFASLLLSSMLAAVIVVRRKSREALK